MSKGAAPAWRARENQGDLRLRPEKHASRERLAHYYSQLTDETLRWRLHSGTLSTIEQEVVRDELARRGVADAPFSSPTPASSGDSVTRGQVLRRFGALFVTAVLAINGLIELGFYRALSTRDPAVHENDMSLLMSTLAMRLLAAAVLAYAVAAIVGLVLKARWTWPQVSLVYLALYAVSLCVLLPAAWRKIEPYLG